jgi:hypothetical protein
MSTVELALKVNLNSLASELAMEKDNLIAEFLYELFCEMVHGRDEEDAKADMKKFGDSLDEQCRNQLLDILGINHIQTSGGVNIGVSVGGVESNVT